MEEKSPPLEWWSKDLSKQISLPNDNDVETLLNLNYSNYKLFNNFSSKFYFKDINENQFRFKDFDINNNELIKKYIERYNKGVITINKKEIDNKKKLILLKTINTKKENSIKYINYVTKSYKTKIYPTKEQQVELHKWFNECKIVYNKCVDLYNNDNHYFDNGYASVKVSIFKKIYEDNEKKAPYDILTDEVRAFCSNLKSALSNLENDNISHFKLKYKEYIKSSSILIVSSSLSKKGIYTSHLGSMKGLKNVNINFDNVLDSRLIYDKVSNKYYMNIVVKEPKTNNNKNRAPVVALDPGEKKFIAFYGLYDYGYIGNDIRKEILKEEQKIRKYQRILNKNKNKHNKPLKHKNAISKKIQKVYNKIHNKVKELHNKTALYLCKNYKSILIPKFETQKMLRKKQYTKEVFNKIKKEEGTEKVKEVIKSVYKRRRLNKRVAFCLQMLSHYRFKQHLINKGIEYGCNVVVVDEHLTSKTCTNCGLESNKYTNRVKECTQCNKNIDRDTNGSRNILIKNINLVCNKVVRPNMETIIHRESL